MARAFNGTNQYLEHGAAAKTGLPMTLCCAMKLTSTTARSIGFGLYDANASSAVVMEYIGSSVLLNYGWRAVCVSTGNTICERRSGGNSTLGWHYFSAYFPSMATAPTMYVDGVNITGSSQTASGSVSVSLTGIGSFARHGSRFYGACEMAECAIYSSQWSAGDHIAFGRGRRTPDQISRNTLLGYWPLGGRYGQSDRDRWRSAYDMTAYNTPTWTDHPRIVYPQSMLLPSKGGGGGGGGVAKPVLFHSYYMSQGMRP